MLAGIILLPLLVLAAPAQQSAPSQPASAEPIAGQLQGALTQVGNSMAALQPSAWRLPQDEQQAMADSQASVAGNLASAVPDLLAKFRAAPTDTGVAFRLYRDAAALLSVTQHSAEVAPPRAGEERANLVAGNHALSAALDRLGDWIESQGSANFTALAELEAQRQAQLRAAKAAPPPPATLVINDANTSTGATAKKKPATPKIPHR